MNNSNSNYDGHPFDYTVNGYKFFVGIAAGVIMLIVTIVVSSLYCTRVPNSSRQNNDTGDHGDHNHRAGGDIKVGLDEATLDSYQNSNIQKLNSKPST
ncbi:hypothetical protein C5167_050142 [Papaver somniferum]|uniref:Uncharacterized protein n=1 Tax=Papaver somniferum TaxID=3469 RepID=A0A4Y7KRB3_PAPSO|nr:hypothetical protein C5167_050142 [Papaver somniferum]